MAYKLRETREAIDDVARTAEYLAKTLKNSKAALNFLNKYDKEISVLKVLKNRQDWKTILGEEFSKNL